MFDFEVFCQNPVIDLRSPAEYQLLHLLGASNFPIEDLESRIYELPVRETAINLFGSEQQLNEATELLIKVGYEIPLKCIANSINLSIINNSKFAETGCVSLRLWQPASIIQYFVDHFQLLKEKPKGLDLACGSGRDSIFLTKNGWDMTGVDYSASAIDNLKGLASRNQCQVNAFQIDIEKNFQELVLLEQTFDLVIVIRYLHRPILEQLKSLINENGFIVYQTFMVGSEKFGSPKNPRFLLKEGELAEVFSEFEILQDKIEYLADGRPTNCFIAKKKCNMQ